MMHGDQSIMGFFEIVLGNLILFYLVDFDDGLHFSLHDLTS